MSDQNLQKVKVIDFGCGTGLVGQELAKVGFKDITGIDISTEMLALAKKKECYAKLEEVDLYDPDKFPHYLKNKFNLTTIAGLVNSNHFDYQLFEDVIMSLKKGGIFVFAARYSYLGTLWYQKVCNQYVKDGRWELIYEGEIFQKYDQMGEGIGRFTNTPVKVFAYRKIQEELNTWKRIDYKDVKGFFSGSVEGSVENVDEEEEMKLDGNDSDDDEKA